MSVPMFCPFALCAATVEMSWARVKPESSVVRMMVPYHEINNSAIRGGCPASHMWIPLSEDAVNALTRETVSMVRQIRDQAEATPKPLRGERAREGGMFPIRPVEPSGIPSRLGREPVTSIDQPDWTPPRPGEPENQVVPLGVGGQQLGRAMAAIEDVVGAVTSANLKSGEAASAVEQALQALQGAIGAIEEASALISGAVGGSGAQTLTEYGGGLQEASRDVHTAHGWLEEARAKLIGGMEKGEDYIGRALG